MIDMCAYFTAFSSSTSTLSHSLSFAKSISASIFTLGHFQLYLNLTLYCNLTLSTGIMCK